MVRISLLVRVSILFLVSLLIHQTAEAQVPDDGPSSVGFANPDSVQPVRAYRLPTWHWSIWTLRANGNVSGANVRYHSRDRGADFHAGLQFRINYHLSRALR